MADDDGISRRYAGVPLWAWVMGAAVAAGSVYLIWRSHKAAATTAAADTTTGSTDTTGQDTTITPINQGLSESQYNNLLSAITADQGAASTPTTATATKPHKYAVADRKLGDPWTSAGLVKHLSSPDPTVSTPAALAYATALTNVDNAKLKVQKVPAGASGDRATGGGWQYRAGQTVHVHYVIAA